MRTRSYPNNKIALVAGKGRLKWLFAQPNRLLELLQCRHEDSLLLLVLLFFYARGLMLKTLFMSQLDAMHERLAQGQLLEGAGEDLVSIPWQIVPKEGRERVRGRIDRRHFVHPTYRNVVEAYQDLKARNNIATLLVIFVTGILMVVLPI